MSTEHMYHINKYIYTYIVRNYPSTGFEGTSLCDCAFLRIETRNGRSCRTAMSGMSNDERDGTTNHQTVLTAACFFTTRGAGVFYRVKSRTIVTRSEALELYFWVHESLINLNGASWMKFPCCVECYSRNWYR